jgi:hypothetical protein
LDLGLSTERRILLRFAGDRAVYTVRFGEVHEEFLSLNLSPVMNMFFVFSDFLGNDCLSAPAVSRKTIAVVFLQVTRVAAREVLLLLLLFANVSA